MAETDKNSAQEAETSDREPSAQFAFLEAASQGQEMTVRDDQFAFSLLRDGVRKTVQNRGRFRLVDSGTLEQPQLEWLLEAGADFYTSNNISRDMREREALALTARRNRSRLACFIHFPESREQQEGAESEDSPAPGLTDYQNLALAGAFLYFSSQDREWDPAELVRLAEGCRKGGARLVYYHQGEFSEGGFSLAEAGVWIHITQAALKKESLFILADSASAANRRGGGLVIHLQAKPDFLLLEDLLRSGAYIRFEYAQIDCRSPLKPIEQAAAKRKLPPYSYFLNPDFV